MIAVSLFSFKLKGEAAVMMPALQQDKTMVFDQPEQLPQFPGGERALYEFLSMNLTYPVGAVSKGLSGTVIVRFLIKADGSMGDIEIVRGVHELLNDEAVRVVKLMPDFIPGRQREEPIGAWYTLPVKFRAPETIPVLPAEEEVVVIDEALYSCVEQMPQYPEGEAALLRFIMDNIKFPEIDGEPDGSTIVVRFIVLKDGSISKSNIEILKGMHEMLDNEVIRVIGLLPDFIPGRQDGKAVNVFYTIPLKFNLQR
jgi:TonB family C-terminal domain